MATAISATYVFKHLSPYNHEKFARVVEILAREYVERDSKAIGEAIFKSYIEFSEDLGGFHRLKGARLR